MKAYPRMEDDGSVLVRIRAESPELSTIGDLCHVIDPGESWAGLAWDQWVRAAESGDAVDMPAAARRRVELGAPAEDDAILDAGGVCVTDPPT